MWILCNPNTLRQLTKNLTIKSMIILEVRGKSGGSMYNEFFNFLVLKANCKINEISNSEYIGSLANWNDNTYTIPELVSKIYSL